MSLARIYTTAKVRKDWTCGKCGAQIKKGVDGRISFAVGFRGFERTRCMKPECFPTRSERESSLVGDVYAAQDDIDWSSLSSLGDIQQAIDDVVSAINEVAEQYSGNEMYNVNEDLQERVSVLESAASELEGWSHENDEPEEEDENSWGDHDTFEEAHEEWLGTTVSSAEDAVNSVELP